MASGRWVGGSSTTETALSLSPGQDNLVNKDFIEIAITEKIAF